MDINGKSWKHGCGRKLDYSPWTVYKDLFKIRHVHSVGCRRRVVSDESEGTLRLKAAAPTSNTASVTGSVYW